MTLIVAIGCTDGVILAADSASTDADTAIKQPTMKLRQIDGQPVLFGGSGDVGLIQKVTSSLARVTVTGKSLDLLRKDLQRAVARELREAVQNHIPQQIQGYHQPPQAIFMFAGVYRAAPWILEVAIDGRDTMYNEAHGYFNAIGSGKPLAQAIFRPHLATERDIRKGKVAAYRIVDDAIDMAAGGLSRPIYISAMALDGKISQVSPEEMSGIADTCEIWRSIEREALGQALSPQVIDSVSARIPLPDSE